jgi:hypothetical protein
MEVKKTVDEVASDVKAVIDTQASIITALTARITALEASNG